MTMFPKGTVVRLNRRTREVDGGRTLIGGAPGRVLYLTDSAAAEIKAREFTVHDRVTAALAELVVSTGIADPVVESLPKRGLEEVTFVIPVKDRHGPLERLLASLPSRDMAGRPHILVVDDCSDQPEALRRIADRHGAQVLRLDENVGPAAARNHGLRAVTTSFVAFVDSDVVLSPDAISIMLRHFVDPGVVLVGPRVLGLPGEHGLNWIGRYESARSSLDLGNAPALVRQRAPVSWLSSTVFIARVAQLGEGFSDGMRVGEDVDLVWTLADRGLRVRYEPAAEVWHEHRTRLSSWLKRKAFYGTGAHPLAVRHPFDIAPAVLAPWSAAIAATLFAQRRWSVPLALCIASYTAVKLSRKLQRSDRPLLVAASLTTTGTAAAITQTMALLLRHWWPAAAVGCLFSTRVRRAVLAAALVDFAIEYRRTNARIDPLRFALARRLDDLAYGAGVWVSAVRGRSFAALVPDVRARRPSNHSS